MKFLLLLIFIIISIRILYYLKYYSENFTNDDDDSDSDNEKVVETDGAINYIIAKPTKLVKPKEVKDVPPKPIVINISVEDENNPKETKKFEILMKK